MSDAVALTLGDPAGIGGEISFKAWTRLAGGIPFFLIADPDHATALGASFDVPVRLIADPAEAAGIVADALPVLPHPLPAAVTPGHPAPRNARATVTAIDRAVALARSGEAVAVCTNPINKKVLMDHAGFGFPGHTEYLAHLCGAPLAVMMLAAPDLRVVPATIHVALAAVPGLLTSELLEATLRVTDAALRTDFGIARPRIAVAGLNPHAGEGGAMGDEEGRIIAPVVERLRAEGLQLAGPLSADTLFHPLARTRYDAAVCMYHDQALIPIKTVDFDGGVNVTLGLDFVRTSPDHGTAYDIAGKDQANPSSLVAALKMAHEMGMRRRQQRP